VSTYRAQLSCRVDSPSAQRRIAKIKAKALPDAETPEWRFPNRECSVAHVHTSTAAREGSHASAEEALHNTRRRSNEKVGTAH
jgi:hypothetical protein